MIISIRYFFNIVSIQFDKECIKVNFFIVILTISISINYNVIYNYIEN